ncbi:YiiX/YebB-like N1pC/P60 family cysteine hydrolase [Niabella insulamsoli]|uniref:YiiX/YebB-like N1pC/P60 family cysteine hydrolase n=1 Tax=Niabella insulamsoli TaxID=3144874 RepID=UPI0031FFC0FB
MIALINSIAVGAAAQRLNLKDLKTGDLLFQNLDCGDMCEAIEAVTRGWHKHDFSHMGMVEREGGNIYIWESVAAGVRRLALDSFSKRSAHQLIAGRLKRRYRKLIPSAIGYLHQQIGVAYDLAFLPDNGKFYCSELIYEAFKNAAGGKPLFKLEPMTFKRPGSDEYFPVWEKYYQQLEIPIPEGVPGCNPGGLSRSRKITIVGSL